MEERFIHQPPGTVLPSPEIPSSPAALFEPMAPAVREPAMAAASVPPSTPAVQRNSPARRWPMFLAIGVVALLLGATAGYFAGTPARNNLQTQRDDAVTQVGTLTQQLDTTRADLESTTDQLSRTNEGLATAQADLGESEAALALLSDERDQLLANTAAVAAVLRTRAYYDLNFNSAFLQEALQVRPELATIYDELLASLGQDMTLTEWVSSDGAGEMFVASLYGLNDPQLTEAASRWFESEVGSIEEAAAYWMMMGRLDQLALTATDAG